MNVSLLQKNSYLFPRLPLVILKISISCYLLFFAFLLPAQTDSLILSATETNTRLTSVIKVYNETSCDMNLYCYELDGGEVLLNMGILSPGRSATIRPKAELGRLYTKNPLTEEETATVYFFGGDYELRISDGCEPIGGGNLIYDCLDLMANVGAACNDGIKSTMDDKITDACTCEGTRVTPITSACDTVSILAVGDSIIVSNLNRKELYSVQFLTTDWQSVFTCAANCYETESIYAPDYASDTIRVKVSYYTKAWANVCTVWGEIATGNNFTADNIATNRTGRNTATSLSTKQLSLWDVYPNPVSTALVVNVANNLNNGTIRLSNLNGQLIREVAISSLEESTWNLDVGNIEKGMYLLQIQAANGIVETKKIVVSQ